MIDMHDVQIIKKGENMYDFPVSHGHSLRDISTIVPTTSANHQCLSLRIDNGLPWKPVSMEN